MTRWPLLLLALLACSVAVSACGGDDGEEDAAAILAETFGEGKEVRSGELDLGFRLDAQGLQGVQGPVGVSLRGPFQTTEPTELPRFDFRLSIDAGGQNMSAGAVSTGEKGFLRLQDQAYAVSDALYRQFREGYAEQARCNRERADQKNGTTFQALGIDPRRWLREPSIQGENEEVAGTATTHIASQVDVPRFLEDVNRILGRTDLQQQGDPCKPEQEDQQGDGRPEQPSGRQLSEEDRERIANAIEDARVDVWSGEDDRVLRRLNVTLRFEVPEDQRREVNGLERGDLRFDLTIGAINEGPEIAEPENARPFEELIQRFGGQVPNIPGTGGGGQNGGEQGGAAQGGGEQGGAAQGGGEQGGGGSAQEGQGQGEQPASPYAQCVDRAGGDIARLQECAELIGQ
jgi:uncharacterized membrane protein YgcG